jgi:hypothetical protein
VRFWLDSLDPAPALHLLGSALWRGPLFPSACFPSAQRVRVTQSQHCPLSHLHPGCLCCHTAQHRAHWKCPPSSSSPSGAWAVCSHLPWTPSRPSATYLCTEASYTPLSPATDSSDTAAETQDTFRPHPGAAFPAGGEQRKEEGRFRNQPLSLQHGFFCFF